MALIEQSRLIVAKTLIPLVISVAILMVFFFGGEAYQRFGIEAMQGTGAILKNVLGVVGFMSVAVLVNRIIRYVIFEGVIVSATGTPAPRLLLQISSLIIYAIAISACARIVFNQDLTFLWAASGVAGLVFGMALRELIQDVFAGIALNIDRATRIGDWIQIHRSGDKEIIGQLAEISWRTTRIKDLLGDVISFPNSKFSAFTITNFSLPQEVSSRSVFILLENSVPADQAFRILQAATLDALTQLIGPQKDLPTVAVSGIKIDGVEYMISFSAPWKFLLPGTRAIYRAVLIHLARAGLRPAGRATAITQQKSSATAQDSADAKRLLELVERAPVFEGLPEAGLKLLASMARTVRVSAGRVVIQAGEAGSEIYIVREGLMEVHGAIKLAGQASVTQLMRPGESFGAATALLGAPHLQTLRSRTEVMLLEIGPEALQQLFETLPASLVTITTNLALMGTPTHALEGESDQHALLRQICHMFPGVALSQADESAGSTVRSAA
jgi:small-conductance mechanosensitive channel